MGALIPRLYPFFRHTIASVRLAVLDTIRVFLALTSLDSSWVDERLLRLAYQNLIVEERLETRQASLTVWHEGLARLASDPHHLVAVVTPHLSGWLAIATTMIGTPISPTLFWSAQVSLSGGAGVIHNVDRAMMAQDLALVSADATLRGRIAAASALGQVLALWPVEVRVYGPHCLIHPQALR